MSPEKKIRIEGKKVLSGNMASAVGGFMFSALSVLLVSYLAELFFAFGDYALLKLQFIMPFAMQMRESLKIAGLVIIPITICFLLLLLSPLFLGLLRYYYLFAKEEKPAFSEIFHYIGKKYSSGLHVCIAIILRSFWRILLPLFPAFISFIFLHLSTSGLKTLAFYHILWYFISYIMVFAGIIAASALCHRYLLYCFIFFDDESLEVDELLFRSQQHIAPMKGTTVKLMLSLTPYLLSCIFIIPIIFVVPYVLTCLCISAKWITKLS